MMMMTTMTMMMIAIVVFVIIVIVINWSKQKAIAQKGRQQTLNLHYGWKMQAFWLK